MHPVCAALSLDIDPIASILNNLATETSKPPYTLQSLTDLNGKLLFFPLSFCHSLTYDPVTIAPPLAASTPSMETLQSPRFTIGCQGGIIKTSPLALRFWPKLGLFPAGGQKDVVAFAIYESTGPGMNAKVSAWLSKVGSTYEVCSMFFVLQKPLCKPELNTFPCFSLGLALGKAHSWNSRWRRCWIGRGRQCTPTRLYL